MMHQRGNSVQVQKSDYALDYSFLKNKCFITKYKAMRR